MVQPKVRVNDGSAVFETVRSTAGGQPGTGKAWVSWSDPAGTYSLSVHVPQATGAKVSSTLPLTGPNDVERTGTGLPGANQSIVPVALPPSPVAFAHTVDPVTKLSDGVEQSLMC